MKCKKCQNYGFFDIFLDILDKLKGNLGQEHVKWGPLSFLTIFHAIPGKMTVFSSFVNTFPPVPP